MFDFEDRASPSFSTGTHFLELLLQLFAEKRKWKESLHKQKRHERKTAA